MGSVAETLVASSVVPVSMSGVKKKINHKAVFKRRTKKDDNAELSKGIIVSARKTGQLNLSSRGMSTGICRHNLCITMKSCHCELGNARTSRRSSILTSSLTSHGYSRHAYFPFRSYKDTPFDVHAYDTYLCLCVPVLRYIYLL